MGLFSFFSSKKDNRSKVSSFTIDFLNYKGQTFKNAEVMFDPQIPGTLTVNGQQLPIKGHFIDDIGMSSDYKYERIATEEFCFWVQPYYFKEFVKQLKSVSLRVSPNTSSGKTISFDEYLGKDQDYIEIPLLFNAKGVSHSYECPACDIIKKFSPGDVVMLSYPESDDPTELQIPLLDLRDQQFGYHRMSLLSMCSLEDKELIRQLRSGVLTTATVRKTGQVSGNPKIWWCELKLVLRYPYPKDEEVVYKAPSGYVYHKNPTCSKSASEKVPISYAKHYNMKPCKKCVSNVEEEKQ